MIELKLQKQGKKGLRSERAFRAVIFLPIVKRKATWLKWALKSENLFLVLNRRFKPCQKQITEVKNGPIQSANDEDLEVGGRTEKRPRRS